MLALSVLSNVPAMHSDLTIVGNYVNLSKYADCESKFAEEIFFQASCTIITGDS